MKPILVFQTDFTYAEGAIAAMYGVVKSVDRQLEIITATHEIPQYDSYSASYRLYQYINTGLRVQFLFLLLIQVSVLQEERV